MAFLIYAIVGTLAQLVDGALGMAFGLTSSTLLILTGVTPAAASAAIHLAETGTTLASGAAHWRLGNVDRRLLLRIGIPGAVGAGIGATILSRADLSWSAPATRCILLGLGVYMLLRASGGPAVPVAPARAPRRVLGFCAGLLDAMGGGGWGPVTTPTLIVTGENPRTAIGTVSASEFLVATSASVGFLLSAPQVDWMIVAGLLTGGVIAAPIAAQLVARIETRRLTRLVGVGVITVNLIGLTQAPGIWSGPAVLIALVGVLGYRRRLRRARRSATTPQHTTGTTRSGDEETVTPYRPSAGQ